MCSLCNESNTKTLAMLKWDWWAGYEAVFLVCEPVYAVWIYVQLCLSVRGKQRTKWQWNTGWQNEREALFVFSWWWPQTDQSAHDFHQLAHGFQHPQLLMNIRRIWVCFYMPVDIMNMDMISHEMKFTLEPSYGLGLYNDPMRNAD